MLIVNVVVVVVLCVGVQDNVCRVSVLASSILPGCGCTTKGPESGQSIGHNYYCTVVT